MRESRLRGSVRGAVSNDRPYRDSWMRLSLELDGSFAPLLHVGNSLASFDRWDFFAPIYRRR